MKTLDLQTNLRIIWAIAIKDITDAFRNKNIFSVLISILIVVAMYQWGPTLLHGSAPPVLALYDAGDSRLVPLLEDSFEIEFREADSQQAMEKRLGFEQFPALGIVLPPDFDQRMRTGSDVPVTLSGYVDHWVTAEDTAELQLFFEGLFSELTEKPVRLEITRDIYTRSDGGIPFTISLMLTVVLMLLSINTMAHLMIDEKETQTLDALLVSPATPTLILTGKTIAGLFYCLSAATLVLLLNWRFIVHWDVMLLACLCGASFSAAMGVVLSSTLKTKQQIGLWGFLLLQPLILPVVFSVMPEIFPEVIISIMQWIPTVALAEIIRLSFVAQAPISAFIGKVLLVFGWTAILITIGIGLARRETS